MVKVFDLGFMLTAIPDVLKYLPVTILISFGSSLIGLVVAFIVALIRYFEVPVLSPLCKLYISFIRGTPTLVQLFIVYYGIPIVLVAANQRFGTNINVSGLPKIIYVLFAFALNTGAYMSETIRSAITSVDAGQWEACYSLNMNTRQAVTRIVIPQALTVALPSLGNSWISVMKDTSLAFSIGLVELLSAARLIGARASRYLEVYIDAALMYWGVCIVMEIVLSLLEKRMRKYEGRIGA
ncbi:MAG: amino acid ABC transporter permease [Synergistaceae bacterium]|jgi:His/Glu/Gln/Arg/opine family amino acid ABC transporter permease subunit|nr:amino acid ABC transporter permease [Synergistaceae bacterium]